MRSEFQLSSSLEEGLNSGHFLEPVALFDGGDWLISEGKFSSWAVFALVWSGVVVTDVLEERNSDLILDVISMDTVRNDPWDISVRWGEWLSLEGDIMLIDDGILTMVASEDRIDIGNISLGSTLSGNILILLVGFGVFLLNAVDKLL